MLPPGEFQRRPERGLRVLERARLQLRVAQLSPAVDQPGIELGRELRGCDPYRVVEHDDIGFRILEHPSQFADPIMLSTWMRAYDPTTQTIPIWTTRR